MKSGYSKSMEIMWYCGVCEGEHTTRVDEVEWDSTGCSCCNDTVYIEGVCPETEEAVRVSLG